MFYRKGILTYLIMTISGLSFMIGSGRFVQQQEMCIFVTDTLFIKFYSDEIVTDIDAYTTNGVGAYNRCTNTIYFKIPSASFKFANSLMGEHYREQYMEVHKYPQITFKGTLEVKDVRDAPGTYQAVAKGNMTVHGVTREVVIPGTVTVHKNGTFEGKTVFWIKPTDYGIKQPSMAGVTAADSVQVTVWFKMVPYTKKTEK